MRKSGGVVMKSSIIGSPEANPTPPPPTGHEAALNSLTETAAVNLAPGEAGSTGDRGATEMIDMWVEAAPGVIKFIAAEVPLGRLAKPEKIAEVAAWLADDRASCLTEELSKHVIAGEHV